MVGRYYGNVNVIVGMKLLHKEDIYVLDILSLAVVITNKEYKKLKEKILLINVLEN